MRKLNLPEYEFSYRKGTAGEEVLDIWRKRYVKLTPEEEVRQRLARFLTEERAFPLSLIQTEQVLKLNKMVRRCDILVHKPAGRPVLLCECKAPEVRISQETFDQASRYNLVLKVPYLLVSNGLKHYCCRLHFDTDQVEFLSDIPRYESL